MILSRLHCALSLVIACAFAPSASAVTIYFVSNTNDSGSGSLLRAVTDAQTHANSGGPDIIRFVIPGAGPHLIQPILDLPEIDEPLVFDGTSQSGYSGTPKVEINGGESDEGEIGLWITSGGCVVRGLSITGWERGIELDGAQGNIIEGCYIGLKPSGAAAANQRGIDVHGSRDNRIGGGTVGARNVISGNSGPGILLRNSGSTGNDILGNYIGTDPDGIGPRPNQLGIEINSGAFANVVGEGDPEDRNVISGNSIAGIRLGSGATLNTIRGNYIGLDSTGLSGLPNASSGVHLFGAATNNTIGAIGSGNENIISGQPIGIHFQAASSALSAAPSGNKVEGNWIGLKSTGLSVVPNQTGIVFQNGGTNNVIGGTQIGAGNTISGNTIAGIRMEGALSTGNRIEGNFIGFPFPAQNAFGNGLIGIKIGSETPGSGAPNNLIGGATPSARNVFGNHRTSIQVMDAASDGTQILGNFIGLYPDGQTQIPSVTSGIEVSRFARHTRIGAPGAGNVISGNPIGIHIYAEGGTSPTGTMIQGNTLGWDAQLSQTYVGTFFAVLVGDSSTDVTIGGYAPGEGNRIAAPGGDGVEAINTLPGAGIQIIGNTFGYPDPSPGPPGGVDMISGVRLVGASGVSVVGNQMIRVDRGVFSEVGSHGNEIVGNVCQLAEIAGALVFNTSSTIFRQNFFIESPIGISLGIGAASNLVDRNNIFGNETGVLVSADAISNRLTQNYIVTNSLLGIDLAEGFGEDGLTENDALDADSGANSFQNFPVIVSAEQIGSQLRVAGYLETAPNISYMLEFFANGSCGPSEHGQGQSFLGSMEVAADPAGLAPFVFSGPAAAAAGPFISATATDPSGSTSEFSACVQATLNSNAEIPWLLLP